MLYCEMRKFDDYLKGEKMRTIGMGCMALGSLILLVGERKIKNSVKISCCYNKKGELIGKSVRIF